MDLVQMFSDELHSIYDIRPPISKAKMVQITKAAMKSSKMYKHVVQCVEKFIAKCRPEYKIPGLYVIDSIVRQSRHQFGADRDVFGSRFSLNLQQTFINLFHGCHEDDKPKLVRVLNLWQRNNVFNSSVIQPLLDMANPNSNDGPSGSISNDSPRSTSNNNHPQDNLMLIQQLANTIALVRGSNDRPSAHNDIHSYTNSGTNNNNDGGARFNRKVLDFDYDDEDDNGDETPTEAEPPLSTTLNMIQMEERNKLDRKMHSKQDLNNSNSTQSRLAQNAGSPSEENSMPAIVDRWQKLQSQHLIKGDTDKNNRNNRSESTRESETKREKSGDRPNQTQRRQRSPSPNQSPVKRFLANENHSVNPAIVSPVKQQQQKQVEIVLSAEEEEQKRIEHEAERKKRGLPDIKPGHLTICSTTLWLGHVPKTVSEADISDAFGEFGTITSIDLIPPRGCAYVCMDRRQDAYKSLQDLRNLKLSGSWIKMAWAPGKGLKDKEFKDYWEVDIGSSYIPYKKLNLATLDIELLEKGGVIDEDTLTEDIRALRDAKAKEREEETRKASEKLSATIPVPLEALAHQLPTSMPPPPFSMPPPHVMMIPPPTDIPVPLPINPSSSTNSQEHQQFEQTTGSQPFVPRMPPPPLGAAMPPMSIPPPSVFPPQGMPQHFPVNPLPMMMMPPPPHNQANGPVPMYGPPLLSGPPPPLSMNEPPPSLDGPPVNMGGQSILGPPPMLPHPQMGHGNMNIPFPYGAPQFDRYECDIDMRSNERHQATGELLQQSDDEYDEDDD